MRIDERERQDREIRELLAACDIVQPFFASATGRWALFLLYLVGCAAIALGYQYWLSRYAPPDARSLPHGADLATALIAFGAALFTYYQWTDTRRELSLEKFYERLKLTNDRYSEWEDARELVGHFWNLAEGTEGFERRMYTFLELDNLEYMLVRYKLGFVRERLMGRAIRTFASRCESAAFLSLATRLVQGSGYDNDTRTLVLELARRGEHVTAGLQTAKPDAV